MRGRQTDEGASGRAGSAGATSCRRGGACGLLGCSESSLVEGDTEIAGVRLHAAHLEAPFVVGAAPARRQR